MSKNSSKLHDFSFTCIDGLGRSSFGIITEKMTVEQYIQTIFTVFKESFIRLRISFEY